MVFVLLCILQQKAHTQTPQNRGLEYFFPILYQEHQQSPNGHYKYAFGSNDAIAQQVQDSTGTAKGFYSYIDDQGRIQRVEYVAGPNGYNILGGNSVPVNTPEVEAATRAHVEAYQAAHDKAVQNVYNVLEGHSVPVNTPEVEAARRAHVEAYQAAHKKAVQEQRTSTDNNPADTSPFLQELELGQALRNAFRTYRKNKTSAQNTYNNEAVNNNILPKPADLIQTSRDVNSLSEGTTNRTSEINYFNYNVQLSCPFQNIIQGGDNQPASRSGRAKENIKETINYNVNLSCPGQNIIKVPNSTAVSSKPIESKQYILPAPKVQHYEKIWPLPPLRFRDLSIEVNGQNRFDPRTQYNFWNNRQSFVPATQNLFGTEAAYNLGTTPEYNINPTTIRKVENLGYFRQLPSTQFTDPNVYASLFPESKYIKEVAHQASKLLTKNAAKAKIDQTEETFDASSRKNDKNPGSFVQLPSTQFADTNVYTLLFPDTKYITENTELTTENAAKAGMDQTEETFEDQSSFAEASPTQPNNEAEPVNVTPEEYYPRIDTPGLTAHQADLIRYRQTGSTNDFSFTTDVKNEDKNKIVDANDSKAKFKVVVTKSRVEEKRKLPSRPAEIAFEKALLRLSQRKL